MTLLSRPFRGDHMCTFHGCCYPSMAIGGCWGNAGKFICWCPCKHCCLLGQSSYLFPPCVIAYYYCYYSQLLYTWAITNIYKVGGRLTISWQPYALVDWLLLKRRSMLNCGSNTGDLDDKLNKFQHVLLVHISYHPRFILCNVPYIWMIHVNGECLFSVPGVQLYPYTNMNLGLLRLFHLKYTHIFLWIWW